MIPLVITHTTFYRYHYPVALGPHRLMLRPRESRDLHLTSFGMTIWPTARVSWAEDVFDNSIATARFTTLSNELNITSTIELELYSDPWPIFDIDLSACHYPFRYTDADWSDLGMLTTPCYPDPTGSLRDWAQGFVLGPTTDTLSLLKDLCAGFLARFAYRPRYEEGTQSPLQTLSLGSGTCRDFAVLFAEAVRTLGFGARIVSGYLVSSPQSWTNWCETGTTHAWVEVFVPGAGWITIDPTNQYIGRVNLIPVAVGRDISQVVPVSGEFVGPGNAYAGIGVEVRVTART